MTMDEIEFSDRFEEDVKKLMGKEMMRLLAHDLGSILGGVGADPKSAETAAKELLARCRSNDPTERHLLANGLLKILGAFIRDGVVEARLVHDLEDGDAEALDLQVERDDGEPGINIGFPNDSEEDEKYGHVWLAPQERDD